MNNVVMSVHMRTLLIGMVIMFSWGRVANNAACYSNSGIDTAFVGATRALSR